MFLLTLLPEQGLLGVPAGGGGARPEARPLGPVVLRLLLRCLLCAAGGESRRRLRGRLDDLIKQTKTINPCLLCAAGRESRRRLRGRLDDLIKQTKTINPCLLCAAGGESRRRLRGRLDDLNNKQKQLILVFCVLLVERADAACVAAWMI